jgi:DNA-binding NtrC family response regulator
MMVDDEDGLRLAVSSLLRRRGLQVIEADSGAAALQLLRSHGGRVDVVLLDLTLPDLPSLKIVEEASRIRSDIRVILTSAYSRRTAGAAAQAPQVRGFIRKPYEIGHLVRLISEVMTSKAQAAGTAAESPASRRSGVFQHLTHLHGER